jgi:hypothetical protein
MNISRTRTARIATAALISGGLGLAALSVAAGPAAAQPVNPDWGPAHSWCPGDPLPATGNHITDPLHDWDTSRCHTYYYVWPDMGNVSNLIWDGDNPPPKPPPAPALISTREQCEAILGIFCPKA